ncbi:MAG: hypothetical protein L0I24_21425, partial [Pseudonocardia sp.]|nr:hypothetical protein [Pseudonocardia sp.]
WGGGWGGAGGAGGGGSGLTPDGAGMATGVRSGDGLVTITYTPAPGCTIDRSGATRPQVIVGTADADVICGSEFNDAIFAGGGDDTVLGNGGNDAIRAGAGDDQLFGGAGNDALLGQGGADTIDGGEGRDACLPGRGANPPTTACP